jgi:thiamine biosynthesis lipoprotein
MSIQSSVLIAWSSLACLSAVSAAADDLQHFEFAQPHMGTEFVVRLFAPSQEDAQQAATAAFDRITELDQRLSDYQEESELSRLSRTAGSGETVAVSEDLWRLLTASQRISEATSGAFDITVGPYVRLWRRARRSGQMPSKERLDEARAAVGFRFVELQEHNRALLTRPAMRLDLGGIAKGYAADEALRVLRDRGLEQALVAAGGDLAIGDPPPGERGWRVAIAPLIIEEATGDTGQETGDREAQARTVLVLSNCGVSTSGDAFQFVEFDGRRYSHIVDPRTGIGVVGASSATVVAPDSATSDALATALSVLGPVEGIALIETMPKSAAMITIAENGKERRHISRKMEALLRE